MFVIPVLNRRVGFTCRINTGSKIKDPHTAAIMIMGAKIPNSWFGTNSEKYSTKNPSDRITPVLIMAFPVVTRVSETAFS